MAHLDHEFRYIVDVDGQLIGIDDTFVDAPSLLARAGCSPHARLSRVAGDLRIPVRAGEYLRLSPTDVLFFESDDRAGRTGCGRLAA